MGFSALLVGVVALTSTVVSFPTSPPLGLSDPDALKYNQSRVLFNVAAFNSNRPLQQNVTATARPFVTAPVATLDGKGYRNANDIEHEYEERSQLLIKSNAFGPIEESYTPTHDDRMEMNLDIGVVKAKKPVPDSELHTPLIGQGGCKIDNQNLYFLSEKKGLYFRVGDKVDMYGDKFCVTHGPDTYSFVFMNTLNLQPGMGDGDAYFILDHDCRIRTIWQYGTELNGYHSESCHFPWHAKVNYLPYEITSLSHHIKQMYRNKFEFKYGLAKYISEKSLGSHCRDIDRISAPGGFVGDRFYPFACGLIFDKTGQLGPS